jgi:rSAM/selenodomain-associated transferase 2
MAIFGLRVLEGKQTVMENKLISVIIPTLNEEKIIEKCLAQFARQPQPFEVIVADGGSIDGTKEIVKKFTNYRLIESDKGRGKQMNAGARLASGEILLFLHADTLLPDNATDLIREALQKENAVGGYFMLQHDGSSFFYRRISFLINWRSRLPNITPYGDQAIFCTRDVFEKIQGYKEIELMEDYDFAKRLKSLGKLVKIDEKVTASYRRYKRGAFLYMLQCNLIMLLYKLGVSPGFLKKLYQDVR